MIDGGWRRIVSYTTRKPRPDEVNGVDYYFVSVAIFQLMVANDQFAEWSMYSQNRYYGTLKSDYDLFNNDTDGVAVLTPSGLRDLKKAGVDVYAVCLKSSLGCRMIRYIKCCGIDKFNFDDKNEIAARVERDYGMFLGIENEVDLVLNANQDPSEVMYDLCVHVADPLGNYARKVQAAVMKHKEGK